MVKTKSTIAFTLSVRLNVTEIEYKKILINQASVPSQFGRSGVGIDAWYTYGKRAGKL